MAHLLRQVLKLLINILSLACLSISLIFAIVELKSRTFLGKYPLIYGIFVLLGISTFLLSISSLIEVKEYFSHFRNLRDDIYYSHRLKFEKVMMNESRKQIIETVLRNPGIHYNLLRNKCRLHPGQFQWHVGILLDYGVLQKQTIGQYAVFFPVHSNMNLDTDLILQFPLRETIYKLIQQCPGLISSEIARNLKIPHRNKMKYHIDKLITANYITIIENGRRKELYPTAQKIN